MFKNKLLILFIPLAIVFSNYAADALKNYEIPDGDFVSVMHFGTDGSSTTTTGDNARDAFKKMQKEGHVVAASAEITIPHKKCFSCGTDGNTTPSPLLRCGKCHTALYCDRLCQRKDWKKHKKTCGSE